MARYPRLEATVPDGFKPAPNCPLITAGVPANTIARWRREGLIVTNRRGLYQLTRAGAVALGWESKVPRPLRRIAAFLNRPFEL